MYYNTFMINIKTASVANIFYPAAADELANQIKEFADNNSNTYKYNTRAIIVPHAALNYSGQLAFEGINQLDPNIKNIFIIAPSHYLKYIGIALLTYSHWETPFGTIEINQDISNELINKYNAQMLDEAYDKEHSIEVQLPLIQYIFYDVKIIPILVSDENPQIISDIISEYYPNKENGFIISSDLSHFLPDKKACSIDNETARMIESGESYNLRLKQACGATGIKGLVAFANQNNYSLIRINLTNSSAVSGDKSKVVGYGAWFLYEGEKNKFIKEYYSDYLIKLCKRIIKSKFDKFKIYTNHPAVFNQLGACFVTLKMNNSLRGCIGSIIANQPLIKDIVKNSTYSAYNDFRFQPVNESEIDFIKISISLLSEPKSIEFTNETELLNKITPFRDGIIIKDGRRQAVYLPSVWEDLPDKELFLNSLKLKAGMMADYFSDTFEAYKFKTTSIEEY